MINFNELPLEYETLFKDVCAFVDEADNEAQLELLRGLMAQMVEDARDITATRLSGKQTACHLIDVWRKKQYKELGYPEPKKAEPKPEQEPEADTPADGEEEEGPGPFPIEPQGTEPDAALLEEDPSKRRPGRPRKHAEA